MVHLSMQWYLCIYFSIYFHLSSYLHWSLLRHFPELNCSVLGFRNGSVVYRLLPCHYTNDGQ